MGTKRRSILKEQINTMNKTAIGIDVGGTRIKSVVIDETGKILHENCQDTNDGKDGEWQIVVAGAVRVFCAILKTDDVRIGISAPGLPDSANRYIACMPGRMKGLENFQWSEYIGKPVYVLNDTVAALMAEAKFGVAANKKNVAMLTLGTGVGGAILINGKPYQGAMNKAGHFGHMVVDDEGEIDITGMPGSLEDCIGNCTIEKRTAGKFTSTEALLTAYKAGDEFAKTVWLKSVKQLGISLASIANMLSPEVIVLGGGIAAAGDALFEPLQQFMKQYEWQPTGSTTPIVKATYGDLAGAIGAACFAMDKE